MANIFIVDRILTLFKELAFDGFIVSSTCIARLLHASVATVALLLLVACSWHHHLRRRLSEILGVERFLENLLFLSYF